MTKIFPDADFSALGLGNVFPVETDRAYHGFPRVDGTQSAKNYSNTLANGTITGSPTYNSNNAVFAESKHLSTGVYDTADAITMMLVTKPVVNQAPLIGNFATTPAGIITTWATASLGQIKYYNGALADVTMSNTLPVGSWTCFAMWYKDSGTPQFGLIIPHLDIEETKNTVGGGARSRNNGKSIQLASIGTGADYNIDVAFLGIWKSQLTLTQTKEIWGEVKTRLALKSLAIN